MDCLRSVDGDVGGRVEQLAVFLLSQVLHHVAAPANLKAQYGTKLVVGHPMTILDQVQAGRVHVVQSPEISRDLGLEAMDTENYRSEGQVDQKG